MPRAPKLKPAGSNGVVTVEEVVAAQQAALSAWPESHYSSDIGYRCALAVCMAALGDPGTAMDLIDHHHRECGRGPPLAAPSAAPPPLRGGGAAAGAGGRAPRLDTEVAGGRFIGETRTVIRGASATVWFRLDDPARCEAALADAHEAARTEPSNPTQPWPHLSQSYALCGRLEEALAVLEHGRSFREAALAQICRQAVAAGQPELLDAATGVSWLDGYQVPEVLGVLLDRLTSGRDTALLEILLPRLLARDRGETVEEIFLAWWRAGLRAEATHLARRWHQLRPDLRSATALAICGQPDAARARLDELPGEIRWLSQAQSWACLLAALGELERAAALWSGTEALALRCRIADRGWLAGHREAAHALLVGSEPQGPLEQARLGIVLIGWGDPAGAALLDPARKALAALSGDERRRGLEALVELHCAVGDLPGGQATAMKLRQGNQRDSALGQLSAAALRRQDVAASLALVAGMRDPTERVKATCRILQTVCHRQDLLTPSAISLSVYWAER